MRRLFEFARYFAQHGHDVSVMTAIPNYPDGIVPPKYRGSFFYYEEMEGVKVYRNWVLAASNRYPGKRMVGFVIFLVTSLINSFRIKTKFDLILASTPPVTSTLIGWILAKVRRTRLIIEIRDLQPESAEDFGNLNRSFFTKALKKLMHWLYRRADTVVAVTDGMRDYLLEIGLPAKKVVTVKSGFSLEFAEAGYNGVRKKFGWEEKFLVLYAGTLGWAHSLETIIEAARQLTDQPDICFVFVGDGQKREALEGMVRDYGLKNVIFIGSQPLEVIPHFLKTSNVLVHSLQDVPIAKSAFPAKLYEYMASGRPIVFGSPGGEALNELNKAGGALEFPPDNPDKLCELIMGLKNGEIDGERLGRGYMQYAAKHHRRDLWASKYLDVLKQI